MFASEDVKLKYKRKTSIPIPIPISISRPITHSHSRTYSHSRSHSYSHSIVDEVKRQNDKNDIKEMNKQKAQNLFEIVYEMIGEKEQRTKEMGTLILLGIMFLFFIISLTGFFVMWFTEYYNNMFLSNLILSKNSETAYNWMNPNPQYDTLLKVHIYNYTNIRDYMNGKIDKIHLDDIGPFTYKEHTTKVNVIFNENYTVTFRDHRSYKFLPEQSVCSEHKEFYVPNVPLLAADFLIDQMSGFKKISSTLAVKAFGEPIFKTLTAHQYLWGYRDMISSLNFASGKTRFGLLMNRNGTSVDSLQIHTGEDDLSKYSLIAQFNGMPLLDFWSDEKCNRIDGSDASMFPPYLVENRSTLNVFLQVLCRKIPLEFEKEVTLFNNINALRYRTPVNVFGHPSDNPDNECYCHNTKSCLPSGVINATKCYDGVPIYPSFPHFFSGDSKLYEDFLGINPQQELHQTYADIHPRFGFPINGASRIQINIAINKGPIIKDRLKRFRSNLILPLIWIEITTGNFTDDILNNLYLSTYGLNMIQFSLKYGTLLMCIIFFGLLIAGFYYLGKKRERDDEMLQGEKLLKAELKAFNRIHLSAINLATTTTTTTTTAAAAAATTTTTTTAAAAAAVAAATTTATTTTIITAGTAETATMVPTETTATGAST